ncbi:hypothetical protein HPB47_009289 [Ixodes persulcatus]|uniref:Uncharacterized protein n=1 Tax=Ixodes persulcatus TaxID=34615 RepID=A0AC60P2K9_IXOPE|nr:hypothetical protein HPB47_009289 [Ixodes persulcatus]
MPALSERVKYVFTKLRAEEIADYDTVKAAVLDELRLTPGEYRKRFAGARKRKDEGWAQFASRTASYFSYYLEARSVESKEDLIHLMVADKVTAKLARLSLQAGPRSRFSQKDPVSLLPGLYSHVRKYHSHSEDHLGFFGVIEEHMDGPTGKLRIVSQVPPRQKYADEMVSTADGRPFFHPHVPLYSRILEPRVFVAFGYTNTAEYTTYYKQKYCDLQGSSVRTFDGVIVKLPETNCFQVVSRDCTPDNKRFLILARSTGNPALPKALKIFIHNSKIEILQVASDAGLVVRVDGSRVEVPQAVPYSHMSHGAELFKIKLKGKFYLIESSSYDLSVGFDEKVLTVQTAGFYRGSLCGLCADNNYDRLNELVGPDRQVHNDTLEFAKSYVVPSSYCTPP